MRIGGLASGMDIDSLVADLMKAERIPLNKLTQQKQIFEWQRDQYRDMNKLFTELENMTLDMKLQRTFTSKTASSSGSAVSATAKPTAPNGTYTMDVTQLATAAIKASGSGISNTAEKLDPNAKLQDEIDKGKIDSTTFTTNGAGNIEFSITTYNEDGASNSKTFTYDPTQKSLNDILSDITKSDLGVRAFYDSTSDKVVMERTVTGNLNANGDEIGFAGTSADFLTTSLGLNTEVGGDNAKFTYNGALTVETSKNTYTLNGVDFTFNEVGKNTITVSNNTDDAVDKIVQFVNKYNEVIEAVNGKMTEERYRSYKPLTDEQKEDMSEKQIELWEERAKSGLLRNDSILSGGLNQMRIDFYSPVSGAKEGFSQLAEIGIKTSANYLDRGKLIIDETKLRNKLQEDPDAVHNLFAAGGSTADTKGVVRRLDETITNTVKSIENKAGKPMWTNQQFTLGRNLMSVDKQIQRFEDRLIQVEDRYWRQFTAMEKAIQKANQQSMYMMQQFGGGMQ